MIAVPIFPFTMTPKMATRTCLLSTQGLGLTWNQPALLGKEEFHVEQKVSIHLSAEKGFYPENWPTGINIGHLVIVEECGVFKICTYQKHVQIKNITIMKTSIITFSIKSLFVVVLLCLLAINLSAQNTQKGFSFQGYARDFSGAAYSSSNITAQFSIYPQGESVEYTEQQSLTTDAYGVFHAVVGSVTPVNFATIDFSAKNYFMKVEVKVTGGDFVEISNTELLAVPYAKAADRASNGTPPGTVISFAGANAPAGYLVCDGSAVSSTTYPELYAAIGTLWGGDATNFNLPDLRGQFLRGQDDGAGVDPDVAARLDVDGNTVGDVVGSYQVDEFGSHSHELRLHGGTTAQNVPVNEAYNQIDGRGPEFDTPRTPAGFLFNNRMGNAGGAETRPKNAYVLFIIKY